MRLEPGDQGTHGRDLVALVLYRLLSEDDSRAVLRSGDEQVLGARIVPGGTADVLPVDGDGVGARGLLRGPGARRAVEHIGVQVGENLDERGRGRGGEAPQTGAVERPQGTKLMLGQRLGELADCGRTVVSGKLRGDRDGQDRGQRIAPPARAAEIGHTMKTLPQASQSMGGPRSRVAFASPLWGIVEAAQLLARVAGQRVDQDLLRSAVGDPGRGRAGLAGKAAGVAQRLPVRRPVARAGEAGRIDEGFCDQNWMAMHCAEVAREPAKAQPQHPRSEVRRGALGQDEEPRVVGDEVKAAKLLLGQPPDPAVAGLELERAGVPTHERQPVLAQHCDVAHTSPDQAPEGQIVVRAHQRIPADPLVGAHRGADRDLAQPSGNQLEHRLRRGRWACAPLWRPRRHLSRDPVPPVASISYRPGKIGPARIARKSSNPLGGVRFASSALTLFPRCLIPSADEPERPRSCRAYSGTRAVFVDFLATSHHPPGTRVAKPVRKGGADRYAEVLAASTSGVAQ